MFYGIQGECKACTKKRVKLRYYNPKNKDKIITYERKREKDPRRKALKLIYQRNARAKSKGKYRARGKVNNAIRDGRLKRLPCQICGDQNSQAHHDDYRKYLEVKWFCFKHHREYHNQIVNRSKKKYA